MTPHLPICVQYLQAFSTPLIALMVAWIAFLQWRTAHQRVFLDLFDRRMTVIDELRKIVAEILQKNKVQTGDSEQFLRATKGADFLFRADVKSYLDRIYKVMVDLDTYEAELKPLKGNERHALVQKMRPLRNELSAFFRTLNELVVSYVQMPQKHVWF